VKARDFGSEDDRAISADLLASAGRGVRNWASDRFGDSEPKSKLKHRRNLRGVRHMHVPAFDPLTAAAVTIATAATDAVYVRFTSAVVRHRRLSAANWSSLWYLLSSFAVISYTDNWFYVVFAAIGSWLGAFVSLSFQRPTPARGPFGSSTPQ
jgi:uncharacterized membrane protein YhaH (DUF805 family)